MRSELVQLGQCLKEYKYRFTAITPESHQKVISREINEKVDENTHSALRNLFGWNLWTDSSKIPPLVKDLIIKGNLVHTKNGEIKSKVRAATLDELLFFHSSYPTSEYDSVFFGPDTYRFVKFIRDRVDRNNSIFDIGAGSGAGGIALSHWIQWRTKFTPKVFLADINSQALEFSEINALINNTKKVEVLESHILSKAPNDIDLYISNPPYLIDDSQRAYRHGGGHYGSGLSVDIVHSFLLRKLRGARLLLYTGSCIVGGKDIFLDQIGNLLDSAKVDWDYSEIDPDIFGEQLSLPAYQDVDRLAAVGLEIKCL